MSDSRPETYEHAHQVQILLAICIKELLDRQLGHDRTKLFSPEKEAYDGLGERLHGLEYGSEEYRAVLRAMKPAIKHHTDHNKHHPEYSERGIRGMSLIDVLEMLCDWKAASLRGAGNSLRDAMDHNQERWRFSDELKEILLNTLELLEES